MEKVEAAARRDHLKPSLNCRTLATQRDATCCGISYFDDTGCHNLPSLLGSNLRSINVVPCKILNQDTINSTFKFFTMSIFLKRLDSPWESSFVYQHPFHWGVLCHAGINLFGCCLPSTDLECPLGGRVLHTSTNCPLGNLAVPHDLLTRGPFQINQISPSPLRPASYLTPLSSKLWGCGGWELLSEGPSNPRGQRVGGSGLVEGGKSI